MSQAYSIQIAKELALGEQQVTNVLQLLEEGATVPFIARYRKEQTNSLDEVQISNIKELANQLQELDKRRESILKSIEEQGKLSTVLEKKIKAVTTLSELEDLYLPYKKKRKTKASIAKEKGLEPLAELIFSQQKGNIEQIAKSYLKNEVKDTSEALEGAKHIIAEWVNESAPAREKVRLLFDKKANVKTKLVKGKEQEGAKYKDYFEYEENLKKAPSHRILAIRRAENEGIISFGIAPEQEDALGHLEKQFIKSNNHSQLLEDAITDSYKRLMKPSMETEFRTNSKKKADEEAIKVFAENLKELLLASPLGQKRILALDPGFRTGCKLVCLDAQGKLLENTAIYPNEPQNKQYEAEQVIKKLCKKHKIEAIAIGNGTASRETEAFVKKIDLGKEVSVIMVNESGASIYSASEVAREEFPDHDVTVRGAVSIGRRLADPLAELVKIDPKSIGVGQYQHDVDQTALKNKLDEVVGSCVNAVGVNINTASKQLLTYVSGLGPQLAQNIVDYRNENGAFKSRKEILKVKRMGAKAFEQCAGFLRIPNAKNPLDTSAVHPERYKLVEQIAKDLNCDVQTLISSNQHRSTIDLKKYISKDVGLPTLQDILKELEKPGRDPREPFEAFQFADGIENIEDLREGMQVPGIVTNVTNFGAFVDIGVHQDGLVHLSQLADRFISDPNEVVKVNQQVQVTVTGVDVARKRISLSMKGQQVQKTVAKPSKKKSKPNKQDTGNSLQDLMKKWNN
ncbi:MAG: RNA-binding transcriptional accessory protein [Cytophagales bacterium]|nr:RNA-binding transcriptional accessory protein [Cytophagales bacterium]